MFVKLVILFTIVPLIELSLLIELGQRFGLLATITVVISTGLLGAALARKEGFGVITRIQTELSSGQIPADSLSDAALVLAGALLLLTPGLITDAIGLALLVPLSRAFCKAYLKRYLRTKIDTGEIQANYRVEE